METLTTAQRLMAHLNKDGEKYYKEIVLKNERIKAEKAKDENHGFLQAASALKRQKQKSK